MVRLVKGAYWDSEVKRAQVAGHADYPVFTRKSHTDIAYLACAAKLLAEPAPGLRAVRHPQRRHAVPGRGDRRGPPRLRVPVPARHGRDALRPGRGLAGVRAPLPHLRARRHARDAARLPGAPAPGERRQLLLREPDRRPDGAARAAAGGPGRDRRALRRQPAPARAGAARPLPRPPQLRAASTSPTSMPWPRSRRHSPPRRRSAGPPRRSSATPPRPRATPCPSAAPPTRASWWATRSTPRAADVDRALAIASRADAWRATPPEDRAQLLERAADRLEENAARLIHLAVHEAGKTLPNAVGEVREAVDFCRYYALRVREERPGAALGVVACISPWNFPLAIFLGQVAAALAAGNAVVAKPAEQTPLIAAEAVRLLREAGVPGRRRPVPARPRRDRRRAPRGRPARERRGVHRFHGGGRDHPPHARRARQRAARRGDGRAERDGGRFVGAAGAGGGRRALLRVRQRRPALLGAARPVPAGGDRRARAGDARGRDARARRGRPLAPRHRRRPDHRRPGQGGDRDPPRAAGRDGEADRARAAPQAPHGHFVAPVAFEIGSIASLEREVFGPVLHVVRFKGGELARVVDAINATGYGLTFGIHSRLDSTIDFLVGRDRAPATST